MSLKFMLGDITKCDADYICHQVNCQGVMGSGVAKAIKDKWPVVYNDYKRFYENMIWSNRLPLNQIQIVIVSTEQSVINMFAQEYYGYDGEQYTSYDAFWKCLNKIKNKVPKGSKIAFPSKIGCCRGGANWQVILTMIEEVLDKDYNIEIWKLEE